MKISRSTIYFKQNHKSLRDAQDEESIKPIKDLFEQRKRKVGIRQLQMLLHRRHGLTINKKKIARLKNKFGLVTTIRKKNKYSSFKAMDKEHRTCSNILRRQFDPPAQDLVYSTDITEMKYNSGQKKAYLSAVKDLATKEIVAHEMMSAAPVELALNAINSALSNLTEEARAKLIVHSDQGHHFTNSAYRSSVEKSGATQSMSRRGNCLDNAPIESFFGHLKDHLELDELKTFDELKKHVTAEIEYYNRERPQVGLKKMPPVQYRRHLELLEGSF